jgi:hypothetical protein
MRRRISMSAIHNEVECERESNLVLQIRPLREIGCTKRPQAMLLRCSD